MLFTLFINILLYSLFVFTIVSFVFIISVFKRDMSIMDIAYGPTIALSAILTLLTNPETRTPLSILIAFLITLWAVRLSIRILRKNWGKPEDARYARWRENWTKRGERYFLIRSYLQVNILQGIIITIIALPFLVAASSGLIFGTWHTILGALVTLTGLIYETIADWQLDKFIARKQAGSETSTIMQSGLFRYSRRPNYFGESLVWFGLAIITLPLPYWRLSFVSPILITYIVTKVTGPMLERIFLEKYPEAYRAYMTSTSYFIPWRPRQNK